MSKNHIALIYEGEKTERILLNNVNRIFFGEDTEIIPIFFPVGENIYMLSKQLEEDDYQTDIIEVVREYNKRAEKALEGYSRDDFAEVYLFFDYDGHTNNRAGEADNNDIVEFMLSVFDNETENGKLYINYPMVESLRDNLYHEYCYRRCSVAIEEVRKYKHTVHEIRDFQDFRKLKRDDWKVLCRNTVCKANCIVNNSYRIPDYKRFRDNLQQNDIFTKQNEKFIKASGKVAVLNSFPLFLLEYYRKEFWEEMLNVS